MRVLEDEELDALRSRTEEVIFGLPVAFVPSRQESPDIRHALVMPAVFWRVMHAYFFLRRAVHVPVLCI